MPLQSNDVLPLLFHNQPMLALELLRRLAVKIPVHDAIRVEQPSLLKTGSTEHQALVLSLHNDKPTLGIIVEAQSCQETEKRYVWPYYASKLRARLRCPVLLCVVTLKRSVARWAATPIRLGGGNVFQATVIGPAAIPAVTDRTRAAELPELAVLSAVAHGRELDHERAARIADAAIHASAQLESTRSSLYTNSVLNSLSGSARQQLQSLLPSTPFAPGSQETTTDNHGR